MSAFIYPNTNLLTATITDGTFTIGPPNTFASSNSLANEERIVDLSIGSSFSGAVVDDGIRIDLGSSQTCNAIAIYAASADANNVALYAGTGATTMNNTAEYTFTSLSGGWNVDTSFSSSAQYWFLHFDGAIAFAEVVLGQIYTFDLNFDLDNKIELIPAVDVLESYGGAEYATQRHTGKRKWSWTWKNISASMRTSLEAVRSAVGLNYKKFLYYDGTSYFWVRFTPDSLKFTEVASNRYSTSVGLIEQPQ